MFHHGVPVPAKTMFAKAFVNYEKLPFLETTTNDLIGPVIGNLGLCSINYIY